MVGERQGCDLLAEVFEARGYALVRDVLLSFDGVSFTADGWDASARVGFEYLTHEAEDHLDLTRNELAVLATMMERGELYVLLVDEHQVDTPEDMRWAAERFLDAVAQRRSGEPGVST